MKLGLISKCIAAVIVTATINSAIAQTALEEVVVTARKRAESLQDSWHHFHP